MTLDSEWSAKRIDDDYIRNIKVVLNLLDRYLKGDILSKDEYAHLSELGYLKSIGDADGKFKAALQVLFIKNMETQNKLISVGDKIKAKYKTEFEALKKPYVKAILNNTPAQLKTAQKFVLQFIFHSDGWFVLHCLKELVNNGKLKPPTEAQKKSLSTIIIPNS